PGSLGEAGEAEQERHQRARGGDDRHPPLLEGGLACVLGVELLFDELGVDLSSGLCLRIRHLGVLGLPDRARCRPRREMSEEEPVLPCRRAASADVSRSGTPLRAAGPLAPVPVADWERAGQVGSWWLLSSRESSLAGRPICLPPC